MPLLYLWERLENNYVIFKCNLSERFEYAIDQHTVRCLSHRSLGFTSLGGFDRVPLSQKIGDDRFYDSVNF